MARSDVLRAAWESFHDRMPVPFETFCEAVAGWDVLPVCVGGQVVGAVLQKGPELHACIKPEGFGRWLSKRVLRDTIDATLKRYGHVITKVQDGNAIGDIFVRRLGFVQVSVSDGIVTYRLEATHGN